jgi:SAM-dependent methyltransferase
VESEALQREHYDAIIAEYEKHYDDQWSRRYRAEFMYPPLFDGIELAGARVLEAMCGSGQTTRFLLDRGADVVGLDISPLAIASYRNRFPGARSVCASILDSGLPSESFDAVVVIAGLHHLHPHVDDSVVEIARLLKPGGHFCFIEPHAGSLPDVVRAAWYKRDRTWFADNEASVDVAALARRHADRFEVAGERYFGGLAWVFVVNSLIWRMPHSLKRWYTPPLLAFERLTRPLQTRRLSCMAACRWTRRR